MKAVKRFLAFDLGASSGRAVVGEFDGSRLTCEDLCRFPNEPVQVHDSLHWDVLRLFGDIKAGLCEYGRRFGAALDGIGVDTWGVDFGLLDRDGALLGNPHHYRDRRTRGVLDELEGILGRFELFSATGVNIAPIQTLCQLYAMAKQRSPQLEIAERLLMMPSVLTYFLTGEMTDEHSNISNSGFYGFDPDGPLPNILGQVGVPPRIVPPVAPPGTIIAPLTRQSQEESGLGAAPVIAVASHDTASAALSVPADGSRNWAFLSSGTWSVLGIESSRPIVTREAFDCGVTNAATAGGKYMTVLNITGLWIIQECRRAWERQGESLDFADLVKMAEAAPSFAGFIDVDDASFVNPPDMPRALAAYLQKTGQRVPDDRGTLVRVALESLALKYRRKLAMLERLIGTTVGVLHVVGGGVRNDLLCRFTANATGIPVLAGPAEATSLGNILAQALGVGAIASIAEGRTLLRGSVNPVGYEPRDAEQWTGAYGRYLEAVGLAG